MTRRTEPGRAPRPGDTPWSDTARRCLRPVSPRRRRGTSSKRRCRRKSPRRCGGWLRRGREASGEKPRRHTRRGRGSRAMRVPCSSGGQGRAACRIQGQSPRRRRTPSRMRPSASTSAAPCPRRTPGTEPRPFHSPLRAGLLTPLARRGVDAQPPWARPLTVALRHSLERPSEVLPRHVQ